VFEYLYQMCPTYGPIFLEGAKLEEKRGELAKTAIVCERGLEKNAKYGPLWFLLLRTLEKQIYEFDS